MWLYEIWWCFRIYFGPYPYLSRGSGVLSKDDQRIYETSRKEILQEQLIDAIIRDYIKVEMEY